MRRAFATRGAMRRLIFALPGQALAGYFAVTAVLFAETTLCAIVNFGWLDVADVSLDFPIVVPGRQRTLHASARWLAMDVIVGCYAHAGAREIIQAR